MLLLEPVDDLLERRVALDLEAVPERPLGLVVLLLGGRDGLREAEEGEGEVDEAVLVLLNVVLTVDDLVELEADKADSESGGGGNCRDNLASNELGLVAVRLGDLVVASTEVGRGGDEVDVVVGVVVLLKVARLETEASERRGRGKGLDNRVEVVRWRSEQLLKLNSQSSGVSATGSFSFTWILTPLLGVNLGTSKPSSALRKTAGSVSPLSP